MNTRIDLKVLLASIAAALAVVVIALAYAHNKAQDELNQVVSNAARLVTSLPAEALTPELQRTTYSRVLAQLATDSRFAYAGVYDDSGQLVSVATATGISIPGASTPLSANRNSWINHDEPKTVNGRSATEVHGPLSSANGQARYRIAYFEPSIADAAGDLTYLASIILPIFLLTPLVLMLLKREVVPLEGLARTMSKGDSITSGDVETVGSFVEQFNVFMDQAQQRIDSYQSERDKLVTAERFLNYRLIKLESILHAIGNGIAIVDASGKVSFANEQFCQCIGTDRTKILGATAKTLLDTEEFSAVTELLGSNKGAQQTTVDVTPSNLPGATYRVSIQAVSAGGDETVARVIVMQDVSGEILARNSRGDFVGHVSHELKTPLNTLSLCAQALQGPDGDDEEYRHETLNIINDEVERLALLINNLLSITQIEMGTLNLSRVRVKVSDLIEQAVASVKRTAPDKKLRFSVEVSDSIDTAQLDKTLISIALNNLLTNAVKYSDEGGAIRVNATESDDSLQFSVTDTGIGIPEDEMDSIFEKFERGQRTDVTSRPGHGLGLALARDIVELHHGTIRVQSRLGAGSKFTIDLWKQSGVLDQAI